MANDERIRKTSVVDTVATLLRQDILTGTIPPGGRILIGDLERRFGVSHIPIREAIRRLESEGFVVTSPQRSTVAAELALDDLAGLYDLRRLIEIPVARRAAGDAEDVDRRGVAETLALLEQAYAEEDDSFWEAHRAFHQALLQPGMTAWVQRTLDQLWQVSERYVRLTASSFGTMDSAMVDHRTMADAFLQADSTRLGDVLVQHLTRTEEALATGYLAWRQEVQRAQEAVSS